MGLLGTLGKIAGGTIGFVTGGPAGAVAGAKIGGSIGKVGDSITKKGSGSQTQAQIAPPSRISLDDIRNSGNSAMAIMQKRGEATKVAKSANVPDIKNNAALLEDPWSPMYTWWEDLGGDPKRIGPIDETRLP